jgi:hypothetical protein
MGPTRAAQPLEDGMSSRASTSMRFNTGVTEDDLKAAGNIADASLRRKWVDAFWAMT